MQLTIDVVLPSKATTSDKTTSAEANGDNDGANAGTQTADKNPDVFGNGGFNNTANSGTTATWKRRERPLRIKMMSTSENEDHSVTDA